MYDIIIDCEQQYHVLVGHGILDRIGSLITNLTQDSKVCIVTDDNVSVHYLEQLIDGLEKNGYTTIKCIIPNGEKSKDYNTYLSVIDLLLSNNFRRSDILIALGGGVVGDLTGFVASTYMRGIKFIQIPTTLLSAVDASVGGKTAIDYKGVKNVIGTFWQPSMVVCDTKTFETLPDEIIKEGFGEVIKYGFIYNRQILTKVLNGSPIEEIVRDCVLAKKYFVENDEKDKGIRAALNFGHTIGHGYEYESKFKIRHGSAVMMGMICELYIGMMHGVSSKDLLRIAFDCCKKIGLNGPTSFDPNTMIDVIGRDKKNKEGIGFVFISKLEKFEFVQLSKQLCYDYLKKLNDSIICGKLEEVI